MRGIEGQLVKDAYNSASNMYGVVWNGRSYHVDDFESQDVVNKYLTSLNRSLYSVVTSAIVSLGFSPSIGFIHTGHVQSFTFDIADLYKEKFIIPCAFNLAKRGFYDDHVMLREFRNMVLKESLMKNIVNDILSLFELQSDVDVDVCMFLWGDKSFAISGKNYS